MRGRGKFGFYAVSIFFFISSKTSLADNPRKPQTQDSLQHYVNVINIAVPIRVFEGDRFVDNLTLRDFDVFEDGIPQEIQAVYLIKKANLEREEKRSEGETSFKPNTARTFYLFFSMFEPDPKLPDVLAYFFQKVVIPGDHLLVITPRAFYDLDKDIASQKPVDLIVNDLGKKLRKDILAGDSAYRSVLADLKKLVGAGGIDQSLSGNPESAMEDRTKAFGEGTIEEYLMKYHADVDNLEQLRTIDEAKFLEFAKALKKLPGQKIVLYFYQKEFVPIPPRQIINKLPNNIPMQSLLSELSSRLNAKSNLNMDRLKKAFADPAISVHFLYVIKNPVDVPNSQIIERQEIFSAFDELAKTTGGLSARSQNPLYLLQQAAAAVENYYLLYYSPKDKTQDGRFRQVRVEVKTGNYRISHLAGYIAN